MTVKELIKILKTMPQNADVVMSSDEEGNSFTLLYDVELNIWDTKKKDMVEEYDQDIATKAISPINPKTEKICALLWPE
jgi:hypothetical protein